MSDPIRELEIANAQLTELRTQLATMAELNASQREILQKIAVERDALAARRADAAESALRLATDTTPGKCTGVWVPLDKWTEQLAKLTEIEERVKALRAERDAVQAQLAERSLVAEQLSTALHIINMQLAAATKRAEDAESVLATIPMASLLRFAEAIFMQGQPLQWDIDAVEKWLKAQPRR